MLATARRSTAHGSGLGKERWVVERTFAWLHNLRRLRIRYERDPGLHIAFMRPSMRFSARCRCSAACGTRKEMCWITSPSVTAPS